MSTFNHLRRASLAAALAMPLGFGNLYAADDDQPKANPEHAAMFKKLDADADGKLTKDEIPDEQRRLFERLVDTQDKNKDGRLDAAEFSAGLSEGRPRGEAGPGGGPEGRPGMRQFNPDEIFSRADRNGDGKLTPDEMPEERREGFRRMLEQVDDDKDGAASKEEFRRGFRGPGSPPPGDNAGRPNNEGRPNPEGRPGMPSPQNGPGMQSPGGGLIAALDADRNGELSEDEIAKASDALKKLDRDGDGKLTQREFMPPRPEGGPQPGGLQPDPQRMVGYFMQQDRNGDGKLSKEEAPERMRENFANIDNNDDGQLDEVELRQLAERWSRGAGQRPEGRPEEGRRPEMRRPDGERRPEGRRPESDAPKSERPATDKPKTDKAKAEAAKEPAKTDAAAEKPAAKEDGAPSK